MARTPCAHTDTFFTSLRIAANPKEVKFAVAVETARRVGGEDAAATERKNPGWYKKKNPGRPGRTTRVVKTSQKQSG
jgi:hypothetical protein